MVGVLELVDDDVSELASEPGPQGGSLQEEIPEGEEDPEKVRPAEPLHLPAADCVEAAEELEEGAVRLGDLRCEARILVEEVSLDGLRRPCGDDLRPPLRPET